MNVRELIAELKNFDMDAEVHFSYNYGDYWCTIVAPVAENVDEGVVVDSTYHNMPKVVDDDEAEGENAEAKIAEGRWKNVVIISA